MENKKLEKVKRRNSYLIIGSAVIFAIIFFQTQNNTTKTCVVSPITEVISADHLSDYDKYNDKTFTVVNIVDGDTVDINIPDGNYNSTRIRLIGVDTPETKHPKIETMYFGPEAALHTQKLAQNQKVKIILDTVSPPRDRFNRLLAYLELPDGNLLNEMLIFEGFGYADTRFQHSLLDNFTEAQSEAKRNGKGLWEEVKFKQLPHWLQTSKPTILDD